MSMYDDLESATWIVGWESMDGHFGSGRRMISDRRMDGRFAWGCIGMDWTGLDCGLAEGTVRYERRWLLLQSHLA